MLEATYLETIENQNVQLGNAEKNNQFCDPECKIQLQINMYIVSPKLWFCAKNILHHAPLRPHPNFAVNTDFYIFPTLQYR